MQVTGGIMEGIAGGGYQNAIEPAILTLVTMTFLKFGFQVKPPKSASEAGVNKFISRSGIATGLVIDGASMVPPSRIPKQCKN
jgi:hypothetical protein